MISFIRKRYLLLNVHLGIPGNSQAYFNVLTQNDKLFLPQCWNVLMNNCCHLSLGNVVGSFLETAAVKSY